MLGPPVPSDVEAQIDGLFQLELPQFVDARNELAARLQADGDNDGSARVKGLAKPSVSAWAVNQIYWNARAQFDALVAAGEQLRAAQQGPDGDAAAIQAAMKQRRAALTELIKCARAVLVEAGRKASDGTLRKISTTLEAFAAYGEHMPVPGAGRLSADIDPPSLEMISSLPALGSGRMRAARRSSAPPFSADREHRLADARESLVRVTRRLDVLRRRARQAEEQREKAGVRLISARSEVDEAQLRVEAAREREEQAVTHVADARRAAELVANETDSCLAEVERALEVVDDLVRRARNGT